MVVLLVTGALYLALLGLMFLATGLLSLVPALQPVMNPFLSDRFDMADPVTLIMTALSIIAMIPAAALAVRWVGRRPVGTLYSITGRFRWRLFGRQLIIVAIGMACYAVISILAQPVPDARWDTGTVLYLVLVLTLIPWQAAAEEVMFRGMLAQTLGAWCRHPAVAIAAPIPLFVIGHDYSWAGLLTVALFAASAGVLAWVTGGLEAPIALHVINNVFAFSVGAIGWADLNATEISPSAALMDAAMIVGITVALLLDHRIRSRRGRTAHRPPPLGH